MQPSSGERRSTNPLLEMSVQRDGLVAVSTDNAIFAAQATRPAVLEQVYREMNAPAQPAEVAPAYPAASVALGATVETAPNMLEDTSKPDMFDNEVYLSSLEAVGQQVDAAYDEAGVNFENMEAQARASVDAIFNGVPDADQGANYGQEA